MATSAEVLKPTNSAFFGLPRRIETVEQAVGMIGLDAITALAVAGAAFRPRAGVDGEALRRRS